MIWYADRPGHWLRVLEYHVTILGITATVYGGLTIDGLRRREIIGATILEMKGK